MNERLMKLLSGLAFFAADGMAEPGIVKLAKEADVLLTDLAQQRGREAAQQQAQPVAWWHYRINGAHDAFAQEIPPEDAYDKGTLTELYPEPHHPRAQLMRVAEAVRDAVDAAYDPRDDREMVDLDAIVDAIQPQAERQENCVLGGTGISASIKLAMHEAACKPAQVNQQMLAALPFAILPDEIKALNRFHECVTDGEGYDVPKEMMKRLAEIGLLRRVTGNYYEHTNFGLSVLNGDFDIATAESAQAQQPADGVALDAERYRMLRHGRHWSVIDAVGDGLIADELDAAIDAALAAHKAQEGGK